MLPVPVAASPIVVLLLVQLMLAVDGLAEKLMAPVAAPAQSSRSLAGIVSVGGLGSVKEIGPSTFDLQPFSVTEISV